MSMSDSYTREEASGLDFKSGLREEPKVWSPETFRFIHTAVALVNDGLLPRNEGMALILKYIRED